MAEAYYAPHISEELVLDERESRHCASVMRHRSGEPIIVVDGKGGRYLCRLAEVSSKRCAFEIESEQQVHNPIGAGIHLAIAATKNASRFEWCLEKITELGVSTIHPMICRRSERRKGNLERWNRVLVSAMKQSGRVWLPELKPLRPFPDVVEGALAHERFIAWCEGPDRSPLWKVGRAGIDALVMVGPEGDFHQEEVEQALHSGFRPVSLGSATLRTETAGVAAVHVLNLIHEMGKA